MNSKKSRSIKKLNVKGQPKISKVLNRTKNDNLEIGEYGLNGLIVFDGTEHVAEFGTILAILFVGVVVCAQIRFLTNEASAELERRESFKWYKRHLVNNEHVLIVAGGIAIAETYAFIPVGTDLSYFLSLEVDSFSGNKKFIENPTEKNQGLYRAGVMSRLQGLITSCISSKPEIFNLSKMLLIGVLMMCCRTLAYLSFQKINQNLLKILPDS